LHEHPLVAGRNRVVVVAVVVLLETVVVDTVVQVLTIRPSVAAVEKPENNYWSKNWL
jgi:hypothetical protein